MAKLLDICTKDSSNIKQSDLVKADGEYPIYGASGFIKNVNFYVQEKPYVAIVKDGAGIGRVMKLPAKSSIIGTMQYIIPNDGVDVSYLAYVLENMNLAKYYSGATIPHIYFKDYCQESVPDYSLENQHIIADSLDMIVTLINKNKEQLQLLDELVKSRFVEMFGNSDYPSESLDNNVIEMFIGPFGSSLKNEFFVDEEDGFCMVYEQKHAIQKTMDVPTRYVPKSKYEELKRFTVLGGDIIVSCRGTIGEIYTVPDNAPMGIMHPSIMKIRLNTQRYNQKFFVFALTQYMDEHSAEAKGSGVKMAVSATVLGQSTFVVPPMEVQEQFSAFVAQVDKSKLAVKQSLEKLETLKKSLMQQYFG